MTSSLLHASFMEREIPASQSQIELVLGRYSAFALRLPAGSMHDPIGRSGTAHLVEHLIMRSKSSEFHEAYATFLARVGAQYTIVTSREAIELSVAVPSSKLSDVLGATLDVIRNPRSLDCTSVVDDERRVIRDEIRRHSQDPRDGALLRAGIRNLVSPEPSFWQSPMGDQDDIGKVGKNEARSFAETHLLLSRSRLGIVAGELAACSQGEDESGDAGHRKLLFQRPCEPAPLIHIEELDGRRMLAFRLPTPSDPSHDCCVRALRVIVSLLPQNLRSQLSIMPFDTRPSIGAIFHQNLSAPRSAADQVTPESLFRIIDGAGTDVLRLAALRSRFLMLRQDVDLLKRAMRLARGQTASCLGLRINLTELDRSDLLDSLGVDALREWLVAPVSVGESETRE